MTGRDEPDGAGSLRGRLHHVEIWVTDLASAERTIGWLLERLGYRLDQSFDGGRSWRLGETYIVVEASPAVSGVHDRTAAGLNHLAFHVGARAELDELVGDAVQHGWRLMFGDRHPHAGGPDHIAGYLENDDGFEVELVASSG